MVIEAPIRTTEILEAIEILKPYKSPGLGGLMANSNLKVQNSIITILEGLGYGLLEKKELPTSWIQANLILIPQQDQDLSDP